jgi:hypothetical protein
MPDIFSNIKVKRKIKYRMHDLGYLKTYDANQTKSFINRVCSR